MPKILTIEDDELIADDIVRTLSSSGFSVDVARTGREGMAKVMAGDYDVVTLDRMLPDLDGLTIVATMRGVGMETPVLVMSAMSDVDHRIQGLRAGGDDYLTKPFSAEEMFARVEVLLRRRPRNAKAETMLRTGALRTRSRAPPRHPRRTRTRTAAHRISRARIHDAARRPGAHAHDDFRSGMGLPFRSRAPT